MGKEVGTRVHKATAEYSLQNGSGIHLRVEIAARSESPGLSSAGAPHPVLPQLPLRPCRTRSQAIAACPREIPPSLAGISR